MQRLSAMFSRVLLVLAVTLPAVWSAPPGPSPTDKQGIVTCGNLVYGRGKTSVCFASEFLTTIQKQTHIRTNPKFAPINAESAKLFSHPFAVMTGDGSFVLTEGQRSNIKKYLRNGGFIVASAVMAITISAIFYQ